MQELLAHLTDITWRQDNISWFQVQMSNVISEMKRNSRLKHTYEHYIAICIAVHRAYIHVEIPQINCLLKIMKIMNAEDM